MIYDSDASMRDRLKNNKNRIYKELSNIALEIKQKDHDILKLLKDVQDGTELHEINTMRHFISGISVEMDKLIATNSRYN